MTGIIWPTPAVTLPAFAHKHDKKCSYCHTAWPQLNKRGRRYKENGYRLPEEVGKDIPVSDYAKFDNFPISARLKSRPLDKRDSGDAKVRALQEIEVYLAGAIGKHWSVYGELAAEDEEGFSVEVGRGVVGFHYHPLLNIQAGWSDQFWSDPYSFLSHNQRLTRGGVSLISQPFGGADGIDGLLNESRQFINVYGRAWNKLFYIAGVSGEAKDTEGVSASNFFGRLAYDITDDIMIGGFWLEGRTGQRTVTSTTVDTATSFLRQVSTNFADRNFRRFGVDVQGDLIWKIGNTRFQGAYLRAEDENRTSTFREQNNAWSVQTFHVLKGENKNDLMDSLSGFKFGSEPSTIMGRHAKALSDEEIEQLAQYFAELK